jgi:hypothetical protein
MEGERGLYEWDRSAAWCIREWNARRRRYCRRGEGTAIVREGSARWLRPLPVSFLFFGFCLRWLGMLMHTFKRIGETSEQVSARIDSTGRCARRRYPSKMERDEVSRIMFRQQVSARGPLPAERSRRRHLAQPRTRGKDYHRPGQMGRGVRAAKCLFLA